MIRNYVKEQIQNGLRRSTITSCSKWACKYRMMGQPFPGAWTFKHHPWLIDMHDSQAEMNIGQKSAQAGFTEVLLNWSFYNIDMHGKGVLYVLPTDNNASDFSASRFDPALEQSPHLRKMFSDVKNKQLKRAGSAVFYLRGSRARNKLISIPVPCIAVDELEEMVMENIPALWERMSGQSSKQAWLVSTPIAGERGINAYYLDSNQQSFFFRCPHCNKLIDLEFKRNIKVETDDYTDIDGLRKSYMFCHECKGVLDHKTKDDWMAEGVWVAAKPLIKEVAGWHVNQLYSRTVSPAELAKAYLRSLVDLADEQEFYNQKLGVPRIVRGGRVEQEHLQAVRGSHDMSIKHNFNHVYTMGIDVGKECHYEIDEWIPKEGNPVDCSTCYSPRVVKAGTVTNFRDLDALIIENSVNAFVVDAMPERRSSYDLCARFTGMGAMCYYVNGIKGKEISATVDANMVKTVSVDRTSWLELALGRIIKADIVLPVDIPTMYGPHVRVPIKVYTKDNDGVVSSRFISSNKDDHYAHARNYAEIALKMFIENI